MFRGLGFRALGFRALGFEVRVRVRTTDRINCNYIHRGVHIRHPVRDTVGVR